MKNFFKKLLVFLLIIPTFFMFGCDKTPPTDPGTGPDTEIESGGGNNSPENGNIPDGGGSSGGGSSDGGDTPADDPQLVAINEAYAIINTFAKSDLDDMAKGIELEVTKSGMAGSSYELENVNMSNEDWDREVEKKGLFSDLLQDSESLYYDACFVVALGDNNDGYYYTKYGPSLDEVEYTFRDAVVYHDGKLVCVDQFNTCSYVDEEYASNKFKYDFNNDYKLIEVLDAIGNTNSYADLSTVLVDVLDGVSKYYDTDYMVPVQMDLEIKINFLEDSKYELVINSKFDTKYNGTQAVGRNKYRVVSYTNYVFTFDRNSIISIDMVDGEYLFPMTWNYSDLKDILKGKSNFALDFDEVFSSDSVVHSRGDNYERLNISFSEIDTTRIPTEESTGKDFDSLQDRQYILSLFYISEEGVVPSLPTMERVTYGSLITSHITSAEGTYDLYWDSACTKQIPIDSVCSSYFGSNVSIYIKPKTVA